MASVEGLRRTGEYIKNVVGRSVGSDQFEIYGQQAKILKAIDRPDRSPTELDLTVIIINRIMFPAASRNVLAEAPDGKIRSIATQGVKYVVASGIDLLPLAVPLVVEVATQNPLYFLGLLGKPLYNTVVQATADLIDARAFRKKDSPKADSGTYDLLENIYAESYDPNLKAGIMKDSQGKAAAIVLKEEVCERTGGSCMQLILSRTEGQRRWLETAHVTEKDIVVNVGSEKTPKALPKIGELMEDLKKYFSQKESPSV